MSEGSPTLDHQVVLMGPSGCGKSTVGQLLARRAGVPFFEGDEFHSASHVEKMSQGRALQDEDREGWLQALKEILRQHEGRPLVLACSALKQSYRETLSAGRAGLRFVFLQGSRERLRERMRERAAQSEHFMPVSLLESQLAILEEPEPPALTLSIELSPEEIVERILAAS
ncbi:MAG: gluconokinase, GntK/IdnK-type [Verrucomicrobiota bacterium]